MTSQGEKVDLFEYPPVCLPKQGQTFSGYTGSVSGTCETLCAILNIDLCFFIGWGQTEQGVFSESLVHSQVVFCYILIDFFPLFRSQLLILINAKRGWENSCPAALTLSCVLAERGTQ